MGYVYIAFMVLATTAGQLLLKKGADKIQWQGNMAAVARTLFNRFTVPAVLLVLITPVFYILALRELELSIAFAFTGLNYLLVSLGGKIFFGEKLTRFHYLGIACICLGLSIIQL
ncbi:hypothetical protein Tfer_2219 [Thermincola ferriacetica]|uniref:Uncharacterized protein n=2 Tax=Thermincola TaxID=278993 RepID=D5XB62_THEPJ|nr:MULTISPECIES: EamA family transporter [Thermincola]ADG81382.1 protein of unknown function DUF6 transmembrane [Thermincola potens JR]KNZ69115.1 hypothetical protein Tfer_2219 [Thermincola ferriacetica]